MLEPSTQKYIVHIIYKPK